VSRIDLGLAAVGAERRVSIWFAIYVIAVCSVVFFAAGLLPETVLLIFISEVVFLFLRPRPGFSASTYRPPAPEQWQAPIAALRWAGLFNSAWAIVSTAVTITIVAIVAIVIIVVIGFQTHHGLGVPNFAVLLLLAAWLSSRPLWIGPLRKALKVEATKQLSPYLATLHVGTDGVEFDMRPAFVRRAPETYRFWVAFAELDEVRLMDGLTAQGYWGAMAQYDPTLGIRMEWELLHFMTDQRARPSIIGFLGFGTHLLVRGPTLMYLIGNADPFGPAAVAAWEAWRATRPAPAAPTA
jgi:hypothetical protein